ncbi:MAG: NAD(P)H-dependent FMN reductase [Salibacteraceae bacterium]|jgi:NAD(P)H-dependent FMN reductase
MGKILAFSGSNSKNSINQKLILVTSEIVEGHEVEVINLRDYDAPLYGIDLEIESGIPASMKRLSEKMSAVDGYIISTPEHNGSMSALLKNTIDWLSRIEQKAFQNKPTVFMSTSPGPRGGISALSHIVDVMPYRGAEVVGHYALGSFDEHYKDGTLDATTKAEIKVIVENLINAIK